MFLVHQLLGWTLAIAQFAICQVNQQITSTKEAVSAAITNALVVITIIAHIFPRFMRKNRRGAISRKISKAISLKYAVARDSLKEGVVSVRSYIAIENERRSYDSVHGATVIHGRKYYLTNLRWFLFYIILSLPRGLLFISILGSPPAASASIHEEYLHLLSINKSKLQIPICGKDKKKWSVLQTKRSEDKKIDLPSTGKQLLTTTKGGKKEVKTASVLNLINSKGGKYRSLYNIGYELGDSYCLESAMKSLDVNNQKMRGSSFEKPTDCYKSMVACGLDKSATDDQVRAFLHAKNIAFLEVTNSSGLVGYWREGDEIKHELDISMDHIGYYDVILFSEACKDYVGGKVKLCKWEPEDSGHISVIRRVEKVKLDKAYDDFCPQCGELGIVHGQCTKCSDSTSKVWKVKEGSSDNTANVTKGSSSTVEPCSSASASAGQMSKSGNLSGHSVEPTETKVLPIEGPSNDKLDLVRRDIAGPSSSNSDYEERPTVTKVVSRKGKEPETDPVSEKEGAPQMFGPPPRVPRDEVKQEPKPKPKPAQQERKLEASAKPAEIAKPQPSKAKAKPSPSIVVKTDTVASKTQDGVVPAQPTPVDKDVVRTENPPPCNSASPSSSKDEQPVIVENPLPSSSSQGGARAALPATHDFSIRYEHMSIAKASNAGNKVLLREVGASKNIYGGLDFDKIPNLAIGFEFLSRDHFLGINEIMTDEETSRLFLYESFASHKPQKKSFFHRNSQSEGDYVQMSESYIYFTKPDKVNTVPDDKLIISKRVWGTTSSVEVVQQPKQELNVEVVCYSRSILETFSIGFTSSAFSSIRPIDRHCAHCDFSILPVFGAFTNSRRGVAEHMSTVNKQLVRYLSNAVLFPKTSIMEGIISGIPRKIRFATELNQTSYSKLLGLARDHRCSLSKAGVPISRFICRKINTGVLPYDPNDHPNVVVRNNHESRFGCMAYFCSSCHTYLPECGKLHEGKVVCNSHKICHNCGEAGCPNETDEVISALVEERSKYFGKHMVSSKLSSGLCNSIIYDNNGKPELRCYPKFPVEFEVQGSPIISDETKLSAGGLEIIIPKVWKGKAFILNMLTFPFFQGPDCKAYQYEQGSLPACLQPFKHAEMLPWASRTFGMCGDILKPNKLIEWLSPQIDEVESEKGTSKPVESSWSWGKKRMWRTQASYACNGGALVYHNNGPIHPKTAYGVWTDYSGRDENRPLFMMWSNNENPLDNDRFCFPNYQDNVVEDGVAITYSWKKISSRVYCGASILKTLLSSQDQLKLYETKFGARGKVGESSSIQEIFIRDGRLASFVNKAMGGELPALPWKLLNQNGLYALNLDVYIPIRTATSSKVETLSMRTWSENFNFSCCHPTGVDKNGVVCNETRVCLKCWNCTGGLNCYGLKNFEFFNLLAMLTRVDVSERYNLANYLLLNYKAKGGGMEGFTEYRSVMVNAANALTYLPPKINQHFLPNSRSAESKRNKYELPMLSLQDNQDALEHHLAKSVFIKGRTPHSIVVSYDRLVDSVGGRDNIEAIRNSREYLNLQCDALEYVQSLHSPDMIRVYSSVLDNTARPIFKGVDLDRFSYIHKRIYDLPPGMSRIQHYEMIISSGNRPADPEGPFFGENLSDYPVNIAGKGKHKRKGLPIFDPSADNLWHNKRTGAVRQCLICRGYAPDPHRWEAGICVTCADKSNHRPSGIEEQLATIATFHQPEGVYNLQHPVKVQPATPFYKKKPTREGLKINEEYRRDQLGFKFPKTEIPPRTSQPAHLIGFTTATRATVYNTSEGLDIELNTVLNRFMAKPLDEPRDGQFSKLFSVCKDLGLLGPQGALLGKTMKFCRLHHTSIVSDLIRTKASRNRNEAIMMADHIVENALMLNSLVWNVEDYNLDTSDPEQDKGHSGCWINTFEPRKRSGYWKAIAALRKADLLTAINVARDRHEKQLSYPLIDFSFFLKRELERHCAPPHSGKREAMNPRIICNPCPISQVIMGPILRPATSYLHKIWHNKSVLSYAGGMTPFQMRAWAEDNVDVDNIGRMFFRRGADHIGIENDFSKFDCTYSKEAFEFVLNVYKYWGLPVNSPLFVHVWNGWLVPIGKFHSGFKVTCAVMNASGRSDTALMNALINGCVQIVSYLCVMQTEKCNCPIVPVKPTAACPRNHRMIYRLDIARARMDLQKIRIIVLGDDSLTICPDMPNIQQRIGEEISMYGFEARDMKTHKDPRMMVFLGSRLYPAYIRSDRVPTLHPCWGKTIGRAMFKMGTASEVQARPYDWLLGNMEATLRTSAHVPILSDIAQKTIQVLAARGLNPGTHSEAAAENKIRSSYVTWLDTKTLNIVPAKEHWPLYLSEVYNMCPGQYNRFLSMLDQVVSPTFLINFRPLELIVQQDTVGL